MSARDELEAVIWRHWPTRGPKAGEAVDAILAAADRYGVAEYGIAADRRRELLVATSKHGQRRRVS